MFHIQLSTWYARVHEKPIIVPIIYATLYPQCIPMVIENNEMSKYDR